MNSIDEICVPVIKNNPNYNELQGNQHFNGKVHKRKKQALYKK